MFRTLDKDEFNQLKKILKEKSIRIPDLEINTFIDKIGISQEIFPLPNQIALLIQLLNNYERLKSREVIILEEMNKGVIPVTVFLGALAEDWPGMSNSILGIVHHKERNVLFVKGLTVKYEEKTIGIVILAFNIVSFVEYEQFVKEKKELIARIKEASKGSRSKYVLLEDETVKFEIYNDIVNRIKQKYSAPDISKLIGESGEAIKFVSSRSREYLEERKISDLAKLIMDNLKFQEMIRSGVSEEALKIKNFETKYEKLTGITFMCKEELISIEDFLKTLNFIVPDFIIKHHKSFVTQDKILVYRIEIVDRYGTPLNSELIHSIQKSLDKLIVTSYQKNFSKIKSIGGYEHYARAIIPFLILELKKTQINQVFIKVDEKSDFFIDIKLIVVSDKMDENRIYNLISKLEKFPGVEINSAIPPKIYGESVEIDILKLNINLSEFSSIKDIFSALKNVIRKIYGEIRDFDQGFREIDMKVLNELLEKMNDINSSLIRDIFFNFDELFRIEIPFKMLCEVVRMCSNAVEKFNREPDKKFIIKHKNLCELNRTIFIISYSGRKQILGKIIKALKEYNTYFTKIEWDQKTYFILVLHKGNKVLNAETIKNLKNNIKGFIK